MSHQNLHQEHKRLKSGKRTEKLDTVKQNHRIAIAIAIVIG